jgi:hypothetical protein
MYKKARKMLVKIAILIHLFIIFECIQDLNVKVEIFIKLSSTAVWAVLYGILRFI